MADTDTPIESTAPPEVQKQAEAMGWIPPTRYKGEPERFIDAQEYLERGEQVLPIVRSENRKLREQQSALQQQLNATTAALNAANKAIEEINVRHSVATQKAVERAREELKAELAKASEDGDHARVAEITDKMVELREAAKEPAAKKEEPAAPEFKPAPELVAWQEANPWFGTDRRKTALAIAIGQELREQGISGTAFFEALDEELGGEPVEKPAPRSKVEGARGSESSPGRAQPKSYAALPADAKAACDADARDLVGKGKRFENLDAWRKEYARIYFSE